MRLAPLVFVRPGEFRKAEWKEFNLDGSEWRIPAERMKMKAVHIVPLSRQAVELLRELEPVTGGGRYVFPGGRSSARPLSDNAMTAALRRMGYEKGEATAHGFCSMASTLLNEQGFNRDWIERQLAHGERDAIRAAYNYVELLPERPVQRYQPKRFLRFFVAGLDQRHLQPVLGPRRDVPVLF